MPLPSIALGLQPAAEEIVTDLEAIGTALDALPATPLEADLPDIVQIVKDLKNTSTAIQTIVTQVLGILSTTRIQQ